MKKFIEMLIDSFHKIYNFLCEENQFHIQRSAVIIGLAVVGVGIVCKWGNCEEIKRRVVCLFVILFLFLTLIFRFDIKNRFICRITKGRIITPKELFKEFSHMSYLYGLLFSVENGLLFKAIFLLLGECVGIVYVSVNVIILCIISMFAYNFLYFLYHIYISNSNDNIKNVNKTIKLYAAIGTTIRVCLGIMRINDIAINGIMLTYTWLQYCIDKEIDIDKKDVKIR